MSRCSIALVLVCMATAVALASAHECAHDRLPRREPVRAAQEYHAHAHDQSVPRAVRARRLAETVWEPLRIKVEWGTIDGSVTTAERDYLQNVLVPDAVAFWAQALNVDRVDGNLYAERRCTSYWPSNGKCASYATQTTCDDVEIPAYMFKEQDVCPSTPATCSKTAGGSGVPNADYVLFFTATEGDGSICGGGSGTVAYASWCQHDQSDRPTMGHANWCPSKIDTDPAEYRKQRSVAIHELAHALGFTSASFPYFRDELGDPRTPRKSDGTVADSQERTYSCDGNTLTQDFPATNTMQYYAERGHDSCSWATPSSCVMKIITPKVKSMSRAFFGCDSLQGAELENQPTTPCSVIGSHWEARLFMDATMAAFISHNPFLTPVTLALFEDSGWYRANYSMATPLQVGVNWGFQQGCEFALDKCVAPKASPVSTGAPAHFCTDIAQPTPEPRATTCTLDRRAQAFCYQGAYSGLPDWYQYFTDSELAGGFPTADYCPYRRGFDNRACMDTNNLPSENYQGQVYGSNSMCTQSTLAQVVDGSTAVDPRVGCYDVTCVSAGLLRVSISKASGGVETVDCTDGTTQYNVAGFSGTLTCIDPTLYCSPKQLATSDPTKLTGVVWLSPGSLQVPATPTNASVTLAVMRFSGTKGHATVRVTTRDGTAKAGADYNSTSITLEWPHGHSGERLFNIPLLKPLYGGSVFYVDIVEAVNVTATAPMTATITLGAANAAASLLPSLLSAAAVCLVLALQLAPGTGASLYM